MSIIIYKGELLFQNVVCITKLLSPTGWFSQRLCQDYKKLIIMLMDGQNSQCSEFPHIYQPISSSVRMPHKLDELHIITIIEIIASRGSVHLSSP